MNPSQPIRCQLCRMFFTNQGTQPSSDAHPSGRPEPSGSGFGCPQCLVLIGRIRSMQTRLGRMKSSLLPTRNRLRTRPRFGSNTILAENIPTLRHAPLHSQLDPRLSEADRVWKQRVRTSLTLGLLARGIRRMEQLPSSLPESALSRPPLHIVMRIPLHLYETIKTRLRDFVHAYCTKHYPNRIISSVRVVICRDVTTVNPAAQTPTATRPQINLPPCAPMQSPTQLQPQPQPQPQLQPQPQPQGDSESQNQNQMSTHVSAKQPPSSLPERKSRQ